MKLDTSGLESAMPFFGANRELVEGFPAAPSFEIPGVCDVSFEKLFLFAWLCAPN